VNPRSDVYRVCKSGLTFDSAAVRLTVSLSTQVMCVSYERDWYLSLVITALDPSDCCTYHMV
jgi:hypothetical protein